MLKRLIITTLVVLLAAPASFAATYTVDNAHSQIHFTIAHLMFFKVRGEFTDYKATLEVDDNQKLTAATAVIQVASIDTREKKRDDHLRSADFFDVANHPEMTYVAERFEYNGNEVTAYGKLTIRGITRDVVLKGSYLGQNKDPWGNTRAGFEARGKIDRRDFGLTYNKALETGGVLIGEEVEIALEVESILQK